MATRVGLSKYKLVISTVLLFVLYGVGAALISTDPSSSIVGLTPLILLLSAALLFWNHNSWNNEVNYFIAGTFLIGMGVEWAGIHTGFPFGEYHYDDNLGPSVFGVPLVVGINWVTLAYVSGVTAYRFKLTPIIQALLAAMIMTGMDLLIEPVAPVLDFWAFDSGVVPLSNYLGWFVTAYVVQLLFSYLNFSKTNKLAMILLWLEAVFYTILNFNIR